MIERMLLRLLHVIDGEAAEDDVRLLSLLLARLPADQVSQEVMVITPAPSVLAVPAGIPVHRVGRRFGRNLAWGVDIGRVVKARRPAVVHAWSPASATLAGLATETGRISVTLSDPSQCCPASRWWFSAEPAESGTAVCSNRLVQRRLIERGIRPSSTLVIRPGVDFAAIKQARATSIRDELGLPAGGRVLLTPSPPSRAGGHFLAAWAMAILHQLWPDARLIIPGESREQQRLARLEGEVYCPEAYVLTGNQYTPAELLRIADALVVPATGDVPTGWLSWAMAAGVPIIASAVPAVAELIADRHNGFLCKPGDVHELAVRIRTVFDSPEQMRQCADTARGQAYDVFRAQACVEQYLRLFQNLEAFRPTGDGIRDTAVDG